MYATCTAAARDGEERSGKKLRVLLTSEVIHAYIHTYIRITETPAGISASPLR